MLGKGGLEALNPFSAGPDYIWVPLNKYNDYIFILSMKRAFIQIPTCLLYSSAEKDNSAH